MKQLTQKILLLLLPVYLLMHAGCEKVDGGCKYDNDGVGTVDGLPAYLATCSPTSFEQPFSNPTNGTVFNYDKFEQALSDSLPNVGGLQVAVMQGGFVFLNRSFGIARGAGACPEIELTACNKMNIASCTKLWTVACVMKMLYDQGLDENDSIGPYLPPSWNVSPAMASLTFAQMMRHRSGLHGFTTNSDFENTLSYEGLKTLAQQGPDADSINVARYRNANLAMMRIVIPQLWKALPSCPNALKNAGEITDLISQTYYDAAIKQFIFYPAGADGELDAGVLGDFETLYYLPGGNGGGSAGNWKNKAGGGGWNMTALDMAKAIDGIYRGISVSTTVRDAMLNSGMGFWNTMSVFDGQLTGHGGDITMGNGEMHSLVVYHTTQNIAIAVNINTGTINGLGLYGIVQNAYNQAWE